MVFHLIAERALDSEPVDSPTIRYEEKIGRNGNYYDEVSIELANGTFQQMEIELRKEIMPILQPLLDFCKSVEDQVGEQFGL